MKNILQYIAILFVVSVVLVYVLKYRELNTQENSILLDVTESNMTTLSTEDLQSISAVPMQSFFDDDGNGENTRVSIINELSRNSFVEASVKPVAFKLFVNEIDRKQEISNYWRNINSAITNTSLQKKDRQRTNLYLPIARELERLNEIEFAQKRNLIVVSDGMIADGEISFYDPKTLEDLKRNPSKYIKLLNERYPLKSIEKVKVIWVFTPNDVATSEQFEIVIKFWEQLITEKQGTFTLTTNL